jgi:hypothetical protein
VTSVPSSTTYADPKTDIQLVIFRHHAPGKLNMFSPPIFGLTANGFSLEIFFRSQLIPYLQL